MLLDTMCNAFGGIILLAILVALLVRHERHQTGGATSDTHEMLVRRLSLAEVNLQHALNLATTLSSKAQDPKWKDQMEFIKTRLELTEQLEHVRGAIAQGRKDIDMLHASDPADVMKDLAMQMESAEAEKLQQENSLSAARENLERLQVRLQDLRSQSQTAYNVAVQELRLPKEHDTTKDVFFVIVQHGLAYPCKNADLTLNERSIRWTQGLVNSEAHPIPGMGLHAGGDAREIRALFARLRRESQFVAFIVFEDSFATFIRAKEMAITAGLEYGWEPFLNTDGPVAFGPVGSTPKPQ